LEAILAKSSFLVLESGEKSKTWDSAQAILKARSMHEHGQERAFLGLKILPEFFTRRICSPAGFGA
jgi:hypothetical protein